MSVSSDPCTICPSDSGITIQFSDTHSSSTSTRVNLRFVAVMVWIFKIQTLVVPYPQSFFSSLKNTRLALLEFLPIRQQAVVVGSRAYLLMIAYSGRQQSRSRNSQQQFLPSHSLYIASYLSSQSVRDTILAFLVLMHSPLQDIGSYSSPSPLDSHCRLR